MIQLQGVSKTYFPKKKGQPVSALQNVDLEIKRGDIFGIIGHSGAGKSTLLRLLNGLEKPTTGSVWVNGIEISKCKNRDLRQARLKIGMIFQHFHLLWSRTVRENIAFSLEIAGKPKQEIDQKVELLLQRVGLSDRGDAYPSQLSGGQKQRVGIARALANDPDVLLCDEATSALDPETTTSILELLQEIHRDTGITMVLITHEMSVVKKICNKVAVMEGGKIVEVGEVNSIFQAPQHVVTRQFLSEFISVEQSNPSIETQNIIEVGLDQIQQLQQLATSFCVSFRVIRGEISEYANQNKIAVQVMGSAEKVAEICSRLEQEVREVVR